MCPTGSLRLQAHFGLAFRFALGLEFTALFLRTVDYKKALGNGQVLSIMSSAEAVPMAPRQPE